MVVNKRVRESIILLSYLENVKSIVGWVKSTKYELLIANSVSLPDYTWNA